MHDHIEEVVPLEELGAFALLLYRFDGDMREFEDLREHVCVPARVAFYIEPDQRLWVA